MLTIIFLILETGNVPWNDFRISQKFSSVAVAELLSVDKNKKSKGLKIRDRLNKLWISIQWDTVINILYNANIYRHKNVGTYIAKRNIFSDFL